MINLKNGIKRHEFSVNAATIIQTNSSFPSTLQLGEAGKKTEMTKVKA